CIDLDDSARGNSPLPALSSWQACDLASTTKLYSHACVFDQLLYEQSDQLLGYDVCRGSFNEGVYVFEDTFEDWAVAADPASTLMKSATWDSVYNAFTNSYCGVGEIAGGKKSLLFGGAFLRHATTSDLDLSSGGSLEFELFMPPIGYDTTSTFCRTGFQGLVFVDYSTNQGANWTQLSSYDPAYYRQPTFFLEQLKLPLAALTASTRFRFEQRDFEAQRDNWALDNVRVLKDLPEGWRMAEAYRRNVQAAQKTVQEAQCCLDTDWCAQRLTEQQAKSCANFSWFGAGRSTYLIRLSEVLLLLACLINLVKFIYVSGQDWLFADEEGTGDLQMKSEEVEAQRKGAARKVQRAKKRLQERAKQKNFKLSTVQEVVAEEQKADALTHELKSLVPAAGGGFDFRGGGGDFVQAGLLTDKEKGQRQNHAMLRVPFQMEQSARWRHAFG
ncbi:hypothetical protein B484DRAFT_437954, partial [Ochromonadaceae sp. CCMP2298]